NFRVEYFTTQGMSDHSQFCYSLRRPDANWSLRIPPQVGMHFAVYGNPARTERQQSRYSTLTYERYLKGVKDWRFDSTHIRAQFGDLSNLNID
ncbi:hypothetical protein EVA_22150, partial [gut metagenome]